MRHGELGEKRDKTANLPAARHPQEGLSKCPSCLTVTEPEDVFCTRCGAELELGEGIDAPEVHGTPASGAVDDLSRTVPIDASATPAQPRKTRRRLLVGVGVIGVVAGVAAIIFLAFLWSSTASDLSRTEQDLAAALSTIDSLEGDKADLEAENANLKEEIASINESLADVEAELAATEDSLSQAEALAERRGEVLAQTKNVLKRVDPLLSSVDELEQLTTSIRGQRDYFQGVSRVLVDDLISFANYLIDTPVAYWDTYFLSGWIGDLNSEIDTVNSAANSLTAYDGDYAAASDRFGQRATKLTKAVRNLQTELREVTK